MSFKVQKTGWMPEIDRLLKSLSEVDDEGMVVLGGLTITGHDYWVILEYGSSPKTRNPLSHSQRGDIVKINIPNVPRSKNHRSWYEIKPKRGRGKGARLVYWHNGKLQVRKKVHHPGIAARGFIRRALADMQGRLYKDLIAFDEDDTLPDRDDLRMLINKHLMNLLETIRESTPVGAALDSEGFELDDEDDDSAHLKNAWGVNLSR